MTSTMACSSTAYAPPTPSPPPPRRRAHPNAIVADIDALLDAHPRSESSLSTLSTIIDDEEAPTSLRPPPRGPKKNRPGRLNSPSPLLPRTPSSTASSTLSSPALGGSATASPAVVPQTRSLPDPSITVSPPPSGSPSSLLSDWSLPPSFSLSPFNTHSDPPQDVPTDMRDDDDFDSPPPILPTSMASMSKVEQMLGRDLSREVSRSPQPREKHRPPALRSSPEPLSPTHSRKHSESSVSGEGGISVSSTMYPSSAGRHSFIDLDDSMSPAYSDVGHPHQYAPSSRDSFASQYSTSSAQHVMYPTPTRAAFRPGPDNPGTARSDSSRLPEFASGAAYQPPSPHPRRGRPVSMLVTPTPTADFFFPQQYKSKPPVPRAAKPVQLLRKAAAAQPSPPVPVPPMTNTRAPEERAEILRKHRKLAQVFGEGVGGMLWPTDDPHARAPAAHHRKGAHSADIFHDHDADVLDISPGARRHSTPTSPGFGDYAKMLRDAETRADSRLTIGSGRSGSPESFMELSDDEERRDPRDEEDVEHDPPSPSPSDERKKMREKLTKLHRFLGSRVPVELALGAGYALHDAGLPPPLPAASSDSEWERKERDKGWMRRRRSSSTGGVTLGERMKDELGEKERVLNVKRAHKMEQMFGTRPPPTLYQMRPARTTSPEPLPIPPAPTLPIQYTKRHRRPGTSESAQALLANDGVSSVYMYYRHSLNSLADIVNKDDRESLAELHHYINGTSSDDDANDQVAVSPDLSLFRSSSTLSARRLSLPARTSIQSISTLASPPPQPSAFQARRRRAAKLTAFFGVDYRELFGDVLSSIERGVREEVEVGSLRNDEVEELMGKLRKLRTRRDEISA